MKRRLMLVLLVVCLAMLLVACGGKLKIKGASSGQIKEIQKVLDENKIKVKSLAPKDIKTDDETADAIASEMAKSFAPYTIETEDGKTYQMTISTEDYTVFTITDSEGNFIYGDLFANKE